MKKGWLIFIGLLILLGIASYATTRAIREPGSPSNNSPQGFTMLQDYLGLTPQQRQKISDTDAEYADTRARLRDDVWQARDELRRILSNPDSTSREAVVAAEKLGEAQQQLQVNTIEYTYELRQHLTPAQREKLVSMMDRGICALAGGPGMGKGCGMGKGECGPGGPMCGPGGPRGGRW